MAEIILNPITLEKASGVIVVRDDLFLGGTKARVVPVLFQEGIEELVYASPVYGHAQIAIARTAKALGKKATIFCAKRNQRHPLTEQVIELGGNVIEVNAGYMSVLKARAKDYVTRSFFRPDIQLVPFGLECELVIDAIAKVALATRQNPAEVWCAAGSGVLTRGLQRAWPNAKHYAVQVGAEPAIGAAKLFKAEEKYEEPAKQPPPFNSCINYDAKVWKFVMAHAAKDGSALFWNLAG